MPPRDSAVRAEDLRVALLLAKYFSIVPITSMLRQCAYLAVGNILVGCECIQSLHPNRIGNHPLQCTVRIVDDDVVIRLNGVGANTRNFAQDFTDAFDCLIKMVSHQFRERVAPGRGIQIKVLEALISMCTQDFKGFFNSFELLLCSFRPVVAQHAQEPLDGEIGSIALPLSIRQRHGYSDLLVYHAVLDETKSGAADRVHLRYSRLIAE